MHGDDERPALLAPEFWLLIAVAFTSALGVSLWWVLPLGLAGLSIASLSKYLALWPAARAAGAKAAWVSTVALSLLASGMATIAAAAAGRFSWWLWGLA